MKQAIKRGQVYGMRCSGTNYLDALITRNFPKLFVGAATPMVRRSFGWKHGDVGAKTYLHYKGGLHDVKIMPLDWAESKDTVLFVIHRNPMNWLQSLHFAPHLSPESYGLNFSSFIRNRFRAFHCDPPGSEFSPSKRVRTSQVKERTLIEEYDSLYAMRRSKIIIFDSFRHRFQNVVYVNLETLKRDPESHMRNIAENYGLIMKPKFEDVTTYKGGDEPYVKSTYGTVSSKDLLYILSNTDWAEESKIGYSPRLGVRLLANSKSSQVEPESLLNISPYARVYHKNNLL